MIDRLGLGYDALKDQQPKLVYASINSVGATGPYPKRSVYDVVIQGISGFAALRVDGKPELVNSLTCLFRKPNSSVFSVPWNYRNLWKKDVFKVPFRARNIEPSCER